MGSAPTEEDWAIQLSIKHGPLVNGQPAYMTNIRGYTVGDVESHMEDLADKAEKLGKHLSQFNAVEALGAQFQVERVSGSSGGSSRSRSRDDDDEDGTPCPVNKGATHEHKSGKKNGKSWSGTFCNAKRNECAPEWD